MFCITEQGSAILHKAYYRRTSITFVGTDVLAFTRIAAKLLSEALRNKSKEDVSISRRPNIEECEAFRDAGPPTACSNRAVSFDLYSVDSIKTPCIHTSNMIISLR